MGETFSLDDDSRDGRNRDNGEYDNVFTDVWSDVMMADETSSQVQVICDSYGRSYRSNQNTKM